MKFKFKPEDFNPKYHGICTGSITTQQAARIANEILEKLTGRFELFLAEPQINKYTESSVDVEAFIEHAYKPKA